MSIGVPGEAFVALFGALVMSNFGASELECLAEVYQMGMLGDVERRKACPSARGRESRTG